jgi:hypothetical protein
MKEQKHKGEKNERPGETGIERVNSSGVKGMTTANRTMELFPAAESRYGLEVPRHPQSLDYAH